MPPADSPLNQIIKNVGVIKLSPFQTGSTFSGCNSGCGCGCGCGNHSQCCNVLITKVNDKHDLMCVDELPLLFEFLLTTGFTIDTSITRKRKHTGEKSYKCYFEGCNFATATNSNLRKHLRKHTSNTSTENTQKRQTIKKLRNNTK
jgi:hypothetical protein